MSAVKQALAPQVRLRRMRNARRMTLRYHPEQDVFTLTLPAQTSEGEAAAFLERQRGWMAERRRERPWQPAYAAGERHLLWGRYVPLGGGELPVGERNVARAYGEALRREVAALLPMWTARLGVQVRQVTLRDMTSRWGSCSVQSGRIALSLRLARLPREFTVYVLVHELNHLLHPDHSAAFYAEMDRFYPGWAQMRERIRECPLAPLPPA